MYNLVTMKADRDFPSFDEQFPQLNQFILELARQYAAEQIRTWEDLDERVNSFFTGQVMDEMEALVPHWCKMASYANRLTLVHVMCIFMGFQRMPEFLSMSVRQQQLMKWIILFHDVEKELPNGKRDHAHAFRSTAGAARTLPKLGFPVTRQYASIIDPWDAFTRSAVTIREDSGEVIQDNRKLPQILDGIQQMFGEHSPATLILKTILLHLSVDTNFWPPPSPLTKEEVKLYIDPELASLLLVMNLGDNDGWNTFEPEAWETGRADTLTVFKEIDKLISEGA